MSQAIYRTQQMPVPLVSRKLRIFSPAVAYNAMAPGELV